MLSLFQLSSSYDADPETTIFGRTVHSIASVTIAEGDRIFARVGGSRALLCSYKLRSTQAQYWEAGENPARPSPL